MQNQQNNHQNGNQNSNANGLGTLNSQLPNSQPPPPLTDSPASHQSPGTPHSSRIYHPASSNQHPASAPPFASLNSQLPNPQPAAATLLDELERDLRRHVVLPDFAPETLALFTLHTFAYESRDVTTYIGVESPEKRCGKTTLLSLLSELVNRPVVAANISSPAFFRVIEEMRPTLLIDEADTFLHGSEELRGILNAGYKKKTCFVWRVVNEGNGSNGSNESTDVSGNGHAAGTASRVGKFSVWCPKLICTIGRLPEILADRCIVIRMQRKREDEVCERLGDFDGALLRAKCQRFVAENRAAIAAARPKNAEGLNDRATEIWEPLLALADLAGGPWPEKARRAASGLTKRSHETNPIGSLLMDIFSIFLMDSARKTSAARQIGGDEAARQVEKAQLSDGTRLFSRELVTELNFLQDRPWRELLRGKEVTEMWLAQRVRPYGIRPRMLRIGDQLSRGYEEKEFWETFRRYIPKHEIDEFRERFGRKS